MKRSVAIFLIALMFASIFMVLPVSYAVDTRTFQPSDSDSYMVEAAPNANAGASAVIRVGSDVAGDTRSILYFDVSSLPANVTVNSATLELYWVGTPFGTPAGRTYWAYRVTNDTWVELEVCWNNYTVALPWGTAGGDYDATNGSSVVMPGAQGQWVSWAVTDQVQYSIDHVNDVAHFLIRDGTEGSGVHHMAQFY